MTQQALVVCYPRAGSVRRVAAHIAEAVDADMDLIEEAVASDGVVGYLASRLEAVAKGLPAIRTRKDPRRYELVVVGTPVWAGTIAPPIRSYIFTHPGQLTHAMFFAIADGRSGQHAIREMQVACNARAAPSCVFRRSDVERDRHRAHCDSFVRDLKEALLAGRAPPASACVFCPQGD